jgi:hypothetical protein
MGGVCNVYIQPYLIFQAYLKAFEFEIFFVKTKIATFKIGKNPTQPHTWKISNFLSRMKIEIGISFFYKKNHTTLV